MRGAWAELNTPSNFAGDWYGELTNQEGHTLLGVRVAFLICFISALVFGAMPYKILVVGLIGLCYLAVEVRQGWMAGDSAFDAAMVMTGAAGAIVPFTEVSVSDHWWRVDLELNLLWLIGIWGARDLALFLRVKKRYNAASA